MRFDVRRRAVRLGIGPPRRGSVRCAPPGRRRRPCQGGVGNEIPTREADSVGKDASTMAGIRSDGAPHRGSDQRCIGGRRGRATEPMPPRPTLHGPHGGIESDRGVATAHGARPLGAPSGAAHRLAPRSRTSPPTGRDRLRPGPGPLSVPSPGTGSCRPSSPRMSSRPPAPGSGSTASTTSAGSIIQTGTAGDAENGSTGYYSWYEIYPAPAQVVGPVSPGDHMQASISHGSGTTWNHLHHGRHVVRRRNRAPVTYTGPGDYGGMDRGAARRPPAIPSPISPTSDHSSSPRSRTRRRTPARWQWPR